MDTKSLVVEGKKIGSTSEFLDNFYASLPSRPSQSSLNALHRPDSCKSMRRLNGWYNGGSIGGGSTMRPMGSSASTYPPSTSSRPMSSISRAASHNDISTLSRPPSSVMSRTLSSSNTDLSATNSGSRPRSSLRRSRSNTHLINGFYKSPDENTNKFYAHGPYYQNPENSPYIADGPRLYKSDRHSFFNGKVFTVRDVPKPRVTRPTSAAEARSLFEPPAPVASTVDQRYLNERRSRNVNEAMSLGDSINHVYVPALTD